MKNFKDLKVGDIIYRVIGIGLSTHKVILLDYIKWYTVVVCETDGAPIAFCGSNEWAKNITNGVHYFSDKELAESYIKYLKNEQKKMFKLANEIFNKTI